MKTLALALPAACLVLGCSSTQPIPHAAEAPIGLRAARVLPAFDSINDEDNPYVSQVSDPRSVGDWITTELTNGGKPVTIQQRVLSRDGAMSVVEVAIKDGARTQTFRLRSEATRAGDQLLDVTRVENGVEHASTVAAYEGAMQKTVPNVERNDGMMDTEPVVIDIGARKVAAVRTTYKVVMNGKPATMSVVHSDTFAWGDLGGDIVTAAGKTLYTTHIVDTGSVPRAVASEK